MRPGVKVAIAVTAMVAAWLVVLWFFGLRFATFRPAGGILPFTFNGWMEHSASRHLFLAQYEADYFARGLVYESHPYPILFFMFLVLAPLHFVLGLPYEVAHNFLSYLYVLGLCGLLVAATHRQLAAILLESRNPFHWFLAFIAIGILVTAPQPWVSTLVYDRDNLYIVTAGAFCYLSTWVFRDESPKGALLVVGIFIALWLPIFIPAWILAGLFFNTSLRFERPWVVGVIGVSALAAFNLALPKLVCRWFGITATGSGFLYRSGLDGSTKYMTSIYQGVVSPIDPRHWPVAFYALSAVALAFVFGWVFRRNGKGYEPLHQVFFLSIPYLMVASLFPQLTSIHPYSTDPLIVVPACFLVAFWSLQREFWEGLGGRSYVAWLIVAGLILMTNLLTVAQNLRPRVAI